GMPMLLAIAWSESLMDMFSSPGTQRTRRTQRKFSTLADSMAYLTFVSFVSLKQHYQHPQKLTVVPKCTRVVASIPWATARFTRMNAAETHTDPPTPSSKS